MCYLLNLVSPLAWEVSSSEQNLLSVALVSKELALDARTVVAVNAVSSLPSLPC
jgi:hypothetical protein